MEQNLIWIIVSLYILTMIIIGIMGARKTKTLTDFVVGSRKAGPWMSAFAYGTTYFSAVIFIGYAGRSGFDLGLWAILIGISNAIIGSYLAWKILASKTRDVTRRLKIKTMPQLFEARYNSTKMKLFSSIIIFIFMIPYSASVYSGLSYLCETVLHIDYFWAMLIIAFISAVYLVLGGYVASLSADLVQGVIMIFGVIAMVIFVVNSNDVGGFSIGISNLIEKMEQANIKHLNSSLIINLIGLCLLTSIGSWGMPQMVQKFYGVANQKGIKAGTIISTLFCMIISVSAYFIGSLSRLFFSEVPNGKYDQLVPSMLSDTLPVILLGVVLVLVLSASVSTLSGITLTSCATLSIDVITNVVKKDISKEKTLLLTRILCFLFIILSFVIAITKTPILVLMSFSWGTISGCFLAPYLLGLWWKKMNRTGAWSGIITGFIISIGLAVISKFNASYAPTFGVIAMCSSFIACYIGSLVGIKLGGDNSYVPEKFYDETFTLQND